MRQYFYKNEELVYLHLNASSGTLLHILRTYAIFVYFALVPSHSWSPNSTDLYFWYLFVELAVVTPVEHRNFLSVVPAAKKSKLGPIFCQNIRVIYKLSVKKQETG